MVRQILIVDDDPLMRKLLHKHLSAADYEVLQANNGLEALDILRQEEIQIVISDWSMPKMNGVELCRAVRAAEAEGCAFIYFIILTAHSDKDRLVEALDDGANDFLTKPFHRQELLARINAGRRIVTLEAELNRQKQQLHKANAELVIVNQRLELVATTDELTGLANRREALNRLKKLWAEALRYDRPLSLIMLDIDYFKRCNDTYGHDSGDLVLRKTAQLLNQVSRASDTVCRIGGEEFLVLCPNTPAHQAVEAAERFRLEVARNQIREGDLDLTVTISLGVAERTPSMQSSDDLLKMADNALYAAKAAGRNIVQVGTNIHKVGTIKEATAID